MKEARRIGDGFMFWLALGQAVALGQLGRGHEARSTLQKIRQQVPDFESRGPELMRRVVFSEENVEMLFDGLRKAGLEIEA